MRIGVVGCGYWGARHVRVFSGLPGISVVAIDADKRTATEAAQPYRAEVATDLATVVDTLDAVVVATQPAAHFRLASMALDANCHVLVEKPLTTTIDEGRELVSLAREKGRVLMSGHTFLSNDAVRALKALTDSDEFGGIRYLDSARLNLGIHQTDVNVLWDLAPHDISIFNYLVGERPEAVNAWASAPNEEIAEAAYLRLYYPSGVVGTIHVSWIDPERVRQVSVVGGHKMAVYDDAADSRLTVFDRRVEGDPATRQYHDGDIVKPAVSIREPLSVQAMEFVDAINNGIAPPADGQAGLDVVRVLCAADLAIAANRPVPVDDQPAVDDVDLPAVIDLRAYGRTAR